MSEEPLNTGKQNAASAPSAPKQPPKPTVAERLRAEMPGMKTAVMWAEILDKPLSRRGRR